MIARGLPSIVRKRTYPLCYFDGHIDMEAFPNSTLTC